MNITTVKDISGDHNPVTSVEESNSIRQQVGVKANGYSAFLVKGPVSSPESVYGIVGETFDDNKGATKLL